MLTQRCGLLGLAMLSLLCISQSSPAQTTAPPSSPTQPSGSVSQGQEVHRLQLEMLELMRRGQFVQAESVAKHILSWPLKSLGPEPLLVAAALHQLAFNHMDRASYKDAQALHERALQIRERALGPSRLEVAESLGFLALAMYEQGQYQAAQPLYERALRIAETSREPNASIILARIRSNLSWLRLKQGDPKTAQKLIEQVIQVQQTAFGITHKLVANSLGILAHTFMAQSRYEDAKSTYQRAVSMMEAVHDTPHPDIGAALTNLANVCQLLGDYAEAESLYQRALKILTETVGPAHPLTAEGLAKFASLRMSQGRYREARDLYQRAVQALEATLGPQHPTLAELLVSSASLLITQGDYATAQPLLERAIWIWRRSYGHTHDTIAKGMYTLGELHREVGNFNTAKTLLMQATEMWKTTLGPHHPTVAQGLNAQAILYATLGDSSKARSFLEPAIEIWQQVLGKPQPFVGRALTNLAEIMRSRGDHQAARPLLEQALELLEKLYGVKHHPELAPTLNSLALVLAAQHETDQAHTYFQRTEHIYESRIGPHHPHLAAVLISHAAALWFTAGTEAVQPLVERALQIQRAHFGLAHPSVAVSLTMLAQLKLAQNREREAQSLLEQALQIYEETLGDDSPALAQTLNLLGHLLWHRQQKANAQEYFLRSERLVEADAQRLIPHLAFAEQQAFLNITLPAQMSIRLSSLRQVTSRQDTYDHLFRWKGILVEALRRQTVFFQHLEHMPQFATQLQRLRELQILISGSYYQAHRLSVDNWKRRHTSLTQEKEKLERQLTKALPSHLGNDPLETMDLTTIRKQLYPGEAFVDVYRYYHWTSFDKGGEDRYIAFVISPHHPIGFVELGKASAIDEALHTWRTRVLRRHNAESAWLNLANLIWRPILNALPSTVQNLWLSPDDHLARLPWHLMLIDYPRTKHMLLTQINAARELVRLRRSARARRKRRQTTLLLIGDVDYGAASSKWRQGFSPLPATAEEVRHLKALGHVNQFETTLLTGAAVSKTAIETQISQATYVHLATHGFFDRQPGHIPSPDRLPEELTALANGASPSARSPLVMSGVALAGANFTDSETTAPGRLTAEEIVGWDLSQTDLLTLSACKTGVGDVVTSQGVIGLQTAVTAAGARSLLMSLWDVPDEATKVFMSTFYIHLWTQRLPAAKALRRAQEAVRREPKFAHPINWAAWVLVGEGW